MRPLRRDRRWLRVRHVVNVLRGMRADQRRAENFPAAPRGVAR
ncbi:hypothetical protein P376_1818 [Streptomyces sp. HCCB10043]|nr:hypothetical protein P376_1818 [Streptomyces sp. HCCB10043]